MTIGESIKKRRKEKGYTQNELARLANVATGTIQQYELGKRQPRIEQLKKIAQALEVDYWEIIGFNNVELDLHKNVNANISILQHYDKLNDLGKEEATKRVEELTYIEKYME